MLGLYCRCGAHRMLGSNCICGCAQDAWKLLRFGEDVLAWMLSACRYGSALHTVF